MRKFNRKGAAAPHLFNQSAPDTVSTARGMFAALWYLTIRPAKYISNLRMSKQKFQLALS
jgi:hypothetical protein